MKAVKLIRLNHLFFMGLLFSIAGSIISIFIPLQIKKAIDFKISTSLKSYLPLIILVGLLLIFQTILTALGNFLISREGDRQITYIRRLVQNHLLYLPTSFFDNEISGQLASRVINDASIIKNFMTSIIPGSITGIITIIGSITVLLALDWRLCFIVLLLFPLDLLFALPLGKINEKIMKESQQSISILSGITTESLRNIRSVKLNIAEHNIFHNFNQQLKSLLNLSIKADAVYAITGPIQTLLSFMLILMIILYGGYRIHEGTITLGTLTSFLIYMFQIVGPISQVMMFYANYRQAKGATSKIIELLNTPSENSPQDNEVWSNKKLLKDPPTLVIKDLSFSYTEKRILSNINMTFEPEQKVAIVGPSGAGKTTIINLITRLYEPDSGSILLDNINAERFNYAQWRGFFGVVSQENAVLSGSILYNLTFGLKKQPSDKDILDALKLANLDYDIAHLSEGLSTIVGEQGIKLSGGQRQRLQIARAYLKNPKFLILDEATSNLDADSEKEISTALNNFVSGRSIITIAHRLSTIVDANKIYFLADQKIKGVGTHQELMKKVPRYKRFVDEQFISNK